MSAFQLSGFLLVQLSDPPSYVYHTPCVGNVVQCLAKECFDASSSLATAAPYAVPVLFSLSPGWVCSQLISLPLSIHFGWFSREHSIYSTGFSFSSVSSQADQSCESLIGSLLRDFSLYCIFQKL